MSPSLLLVSQIIEFGEYRLVVQCLSLFFKIIYGACWCRVGQVTYFTIVIIGGTAIYKDCVNQ